MSHKSSHSYVVRSPKPVDSESLAGARAKREAKWLARWQTKNWITVMLWPLSVLYEFTMLIRHIAYQAGFFKVYTAPVPVIVVGGVLVGGVGKTPVVNALVKLLVHAGFKPAIVARGYGAKSNNGRGVQPQEVLRNSLPTEVGDEPLLHLMNTGLPVWVGADRSATVRALCAAHPEVDVIVSDDGLQHRRLGRDIELVVMDSRGLGNGWCLPAGPLREGPTRVSVADAVIWHQRCENLTDVAAAKIVVPNPNNPNYFAFKSYVSDAYSLFDTKQKLPLSFFSGKDTLSIAGIAQPEVFFRMLKAHNVHGHTMALPDHFTFDESFIKLMDSQKVSYVLMTEKDAVKYRHLIKETPENLDRLWVVPLQVLDTSELQRLEHFLITRLQSLKKDRRMSN